MFCFEPSDCIGRMSRRYNPRGGWADFAYWYYLLRVSSSVPI
ncbi:hypothetical protein HMPREF1051_2974 [Neisseria sicca VK64]|uniref:Uncharacterized protein n=1 Tax=Neisseria sicca VK64 TaxID=1095748 RepID=I2NUY2_NEISI|nr:hypothetical protein HMPREF1051_2974 [Neisseria sicca VK64]